MAKRQLHEFGLKVNGIKWVCGKELLEGLTLNKKRRYVFSGPTEGYLYTNQGTLHFRTEAGFVCDMRSGPKIIDWYVPNLGTMAEREAWFLHDLLGYGQSLGFADTNLLLFAILKCRAKYAYPKAKLVQTAVSLSKSWYGEPKQDDWCYANIGKVLTDWEAT